MRSEARLQLDYQMLVEQLPGAVYRATPGADGTWFYVSPQVQRIAGASASEFEADSGLWLSLIHPEDRKAVLLVEDRAALTGEPYLAEYRLVRPDGSIVWVRDEAAVLTDDAGNTVLQGVLLDITDRKNAELEMESSVSSLQATLEATADGILVVDRTGDVLWFNQRFLLLWDVPDELARVGNGDRLLAHLVEQTTDPDAFIKKVEELHADPDREDFDVVEFKDGRVYERFSTPRRVAGLSAGRVWSFRDRTGERAAAEQLRVSESRLSTIVESEPECVKLIDREGTLLEMNPAGLEMVEAECLDDVAGMCIYDMVAEEDKQAFAELNDKIFRGERGSLSFDLIGLKGGRRRIETHAAPFKNANGEVIAHLAIALDVTKRERLERQLRQSQKLEAIGRLAGGIAHDFNNVLTVIANYASFINDGLPVGDELREDAAEIIRASDRAASLVRQLLAFSRRDVIRPRVLDFNEVIRDTERLLRRTIGENIEIAMKPMEDSVYVLMDPEQFEQVLLNLGLNARDAMPNGGTLTVAASLVDLDEHAIAFIPDVTAGRYACVIVGDTGAGMDDDVKAHIFEPFFTTKGRTEGTGLGLASVYGIVKQAGGHVGVESESGIGSTFFVYLPLTDERPAAAPRMDVTPTTTATGRIALVEDEEPVRRLVSRILERAGYEVLTFSSGDQLLALEEHYDLLLTDVVMPGMSGVELSSRLTSKHPDLMVLLMSGHAEEVVFSNQEVNANRSLLLKPFSKEELLTRVRELLASSPRVPA
jgi:two-component system, cell cycle sensor histidine kinase and response regulator CckA